ncbi:MAG: STAS domain-containing protein [Thermodesulfobacteriota bacterium]|nr:STAS domain-containing protein [Thermodesulfobacteriota bacterium]
MELIKRKVGDILVVGFAETGPLEASNVGPFRETMANLVENTTKLLIDIGNVTFLDSSGLGALVAIWKSISSRDGEVKLCRIDPSVRTVFELTRIHRILEIYDTEEEALANYQAGSDG